MVPLLEFRTIFDPFFKRFLEEKIIEVSKYTNNQRIISLCSHIQSLALQGGKRLRPYLVDLGFHVGQSESPERVLSLGMVIELFHLFALIHDDVMDQGETRHGLSTIHTSVYQQLKKELKTGDLHRVSESQGILAGDLVVSWMSEALERALEAVPASLVKSIKKEVTRMMNQVIIGQMLDIDFTVSELVSLSQLEEKLFLKTATYSFVSPLSLGVILSGNTDQDLMNTVQALGRALGIAFQIRDDWLDLTAKSDDTQKSVFKDLQERQQTIFTAYITEHGTAKQKNELVTLFGAKLTEEDRPQIIKLFKESGAFDFGKKKMDTFFNEAKSLLKQSKISDSRKTEFHQLITFLEERTI